MEFRTNMFDAKQTQTVKSNIVNMFTGLLFACVSKLDEDYTICSKEEQYLAFYQIFSSLFQFINAV